MYRRWIVTAVLGFGITISGIAHAQSYEEVKQRARQHNDSKRKAQEKLQNLDQLKKMNLIKEYKIFADRGLSIASGFFNRSEDTILVYSHLDRPSFQANSYSYLDGPGKIYEFKGPGIDKNLTLQYDIIQLFSDHTPANLANGGVVQQVRIDYKLKWSNNCSKNYIYRTHSVLDPDVDPNDLDNYSKIHNRTTQWFNMRSCEQDILTKKYEGIQWITVFQIFVFKNAKGEYIISSKLGNKDGQLGETNNSFLMPHKMLKNPIFREISKITNKDIIRSADTLIASYIKNPEILDIYSIPFGNLQCDWSENTYGELCSVPFLHKSFTLKVGPKPSQVSSEGGLPSSEKPSSNTKRLLPADNPTMPVRQTGYLGISVSPVSHDLAEALNMRAVVGELVNEILPGSPAEKSTLRPGDIIYTVNGKTINPIIGATVAQSIASLSAGSTVKLGVLRQGSKFEIVEIVLGNRP